MLQLALREQASFTLISGEVGTGKTIMVRKFLQMLPRNSSVGLVTNTHESIGSLIEWILLSFGLNYKGHDKIELYENLNRFLIEQRRNGRASLLIIDEAQNLSLSALEELRMLSNVNEDKRLVLQIILVGQLEILEKLNRPEMRQLAQRISVNFRLDPLNLTETYRYIRHRIRVAGGRPDIFEDAACVAAYQFSGGLPRLINVICEAALVYAFGEGLSKVTAENVLDAVEDRQRSGLRDISKDLLEFDREKIKREILDALATQPLYEARDDSAGEPIILGPDGIQGEADDDLEEFEGEQMEFPADEPTGARLQRDILARLKSAESGDGHMQAIPVHSPHLKPSQGKGTVKQRRRRRSSGGSALWRMMIAGSLATIVVSLVVIGFTLFDLGGRPIFEFVFLHNGGSGEQALIGRAPGEGKASGEEGAAEDAAPAVKEESGKDDTKADTGDSAQDSAVTAEASPKVGSQKAALDQASKEVLVPEGFHAALAFIADEKETQSTYKDAFAHLFSLWGLNYRDLKGQTPCLKAEAGGLACRELLGDWEAIKERDLPALIRLTSRDGKEVYATLSEIKNGTAGFKIAGQSVSGAPNDIYPYWDGRYLVLERSKYDYRKDLLLGDAGEDVAWLRIQLSQLYNTNLPKGDNFDEDLVSLVIRFQRDQGLDPDGIVGKRTYGALMGKLQDMKVPSIAREGEKSLSGAGEKEG